MSAAPLPLALAEVLARGDIWRGDTLASLPEKALPSGHPELDEELPGGWLALVAPPWLPHAPAWVEAGLVLERLVIVKAGKQAAWCCEQLLACGGFAGVLAWPEAGVDAKVLRRLQAAAEGRATFTWLWRPVSLASTPSPAPLRLALAAGEGGLSVRILKRRGRPAARPLHLSIARPGRLPRALVGPSLSLAAARSAVTEAIA